MKRKIAAIFASDIAQYSRLVAEDEEETVHRVDSLRTVLDDLISRDSGRIFNTAGDAFYAEFPSAVDAVRCAIDIQESLRIRNLDYQPSRHISLRIGITIGDVVERDGSLMGDGVNIAARLEGISEVGGICVSRAVYEQVANKLSVQFTDIGEQRVKNIPTPVHALLMQMRPGQKPVGPPAQNRPKRPARSISPGMAVAGGIGVLGIATLAYAYLATPTFVRKDIPSGTETSSLTTINVPAPSRIENEALVPETVPFIRDSDRVVIREVYLSAADYKALALSYNRIGFITGQRDEETAKTAALDACKRATGTRSPCELYAVGNVVVSHRGRVPMPPEPWVIRDPSIETPFESADIPFGRDPSRKFRENYLKARAPKALALSPVGIHNFYSGVASVDEAVRRSLEKCGSESGAACLIAAIDDVFVVPIPKSMKPIGLYRAGQIQSIAPELRDDAARRLVNATKGWNAIAVGASGRVGLALGTAGEKEAIDKAMANCARQERDCRVVAIGPFLVEGP